jgi:hypothetical protein
MIKSQLPTKSLIWQDLEAHYLEVRDLHLRDLFEENPDRCKQMSVDAVGIYFDYSKHRVTDETLKLLLQLAKESGLKDRIDAMFRGDKINVTENRAVLHTALRHLKVNPSWWMVLTSFHRFMLFLTGWLIFQIGYEEGNGRGILASQYVTSSILVLVVLI